jgi:hypothetical protein
VGTAPSLRNPGSRPGGVWMAEYVATMAPAEPTGGHAVAERFQHGPGASQPALATIPGRQVVAERGVAGRTGPSPQVAPPALNKACRLRGDENEDGHARSASGRPPDHSGDTRMVRAPGRGVAELDKRPRYKSWFIALSTVRPLNLQHLMRRCVVVCRSRQSRWHPVRHRQSAQDVDARADKRGLYSELPPIRRVEGS